MEEATLTYRMKFSAGYDWTAGGKLPGLSAEGVCPCMCCCSSSHVYWKRVPILGSLYYQAVCVRFGYKRTAQIYLIDSSAPVPRTLDETGPAFPIPRPHHSDGLHERVCMQMGHMAAAETATCPKLVAGRIDSCFDRALQVCLHFSTLCQHLCISTGDTISTLQTTDYCSDLTIKMFTSELSLLQGRKACELHVLSNSGRLRR